MESEACLFCGAPPQGLCKAPHDSGMRGSAKNREVPLSITALCGGFESNTCPWPCPPPGFSSLRPASFSSSLSSPLREPVVVAAVGEVGGGHHGRAIQWLRGPSIPPPRRFKLAASHRCGQLAPHRRCGKRPRVVRNMYKQRRPPRLAPQKTCLASKGGLVAHPEVLQAALLVA